ncbi:MAG: hypothetical protein HeimC2_14460 [Candidatus Heimdallarchaeota archaeon LC_2]|nr:MAG: hypothetical protein HeimC2_14460 [Candidatus Heimdallarchaeota archaeon LC_2]
MHKVELGNPEDYKKVDKILWRAFEIENKFDEDKREPGDWWSKEGFSRSYIIKDRDSIVANLTVELYPATIRGSEIIIAGIGAVATEPTHRRNKMINSLFETAFQTMKDNGEIFSMLDPFKIEYYRKFGYANAETIIQYRFAPSNIITLKIPNSIIIREAVKGDEQILMDLQRSSIQIGSRLYQTEDSIAKRIKSLNCYIVEEKNKPAGWFKLYFNRDKTEIEWNDQKLTMIVSLSLFYDNYNVLNGIFDFLSKFEDQVDEIRMNCPSEVPVQNYVINRHKLDIDMMGSMMVRVIDFKKYIESIQIPKSATDSVVLTLEDKHCTWNSGTYVLVPSNGKINLREEVLEPDIVVNEQQFSRIAGGLNSITTLHLLGIIDCSLEVAQKLEAIFPKDAVMSYQRF